MGNASSRRKKGGRPPPTAQEKLAASRALLTVVGFEQNDVLRALLDAAGDEDAALTLLIERKCGGESGGDAIRIRSTYESKKYARDRGHKEERHARLGKQLLARSLSSEHSVSSARVIEVAVMVKKWKAAPLPLEVRASLPPSLRPAVAVDAYEPDDAACSEDEFGSRDVGKGKEN